MFKEWVDLLRIRQYYKNLLIFVPFFFSNSNIELYVFGIVGFLILCMFSSAGYIFNDLLDYKKDRIHKDKKNRPLASGLISKKHALIVIFILGGIASSVAYSMNLLFFICGFSMFVNMIAYSLVFKRWAIVDLHSISYNYIMRALSGVFLSFNLISPWLIFLVLVMALFLATGKRKSDMMLLIFGLVSYSIVGCLVYELYYVYIYGSW
jgi:4-hydroxybenzoate polyprenyltransferase